MKKENWQVWLVAFCFVALYAVLFVVSYWMGFAKERGAAQTVYAILFLAHCLCFDAAICVHSETQTQAAVLVCANTVPCAAYAICLLF